MALVLPIKTLHVESPKSHLPRHRMIQTRTVSGEGAQIGFDIFCDLICDPATY